jgi:hypothetical protein
VRLTGLGFEFYEAELAGCEEAVAPGCVYVGDGRVDDGRFGGAADLRQVGEQGGEVQEPAIKCLSPLSLDCVVSCSTFGGVCTPAGFAFHLS